VNRRNGGQGSRSANGAASPDRAKAGGGGAIATTSSATPGTVARPLRSLPAAIRLAQARRRSAYP
jgi:hypothetical protein